VDELKAELEVFHRLYSDGNEQFIPVSNHAKRIAQLLRKYLLMPEALTA